MISPPRRLLIIKPSSFGDIVHSLPALAVLRRHWPQTLIDWLIKEEWAELLIDHPALNDVLVFPMDLSGWYRLQKQLRDHHYDWVIDLQGLLRSGVASLLCNAPMRVGFADSREGSRWCYTARIQPTARAVHAVDRGLDLLDQLGLANRHPVTFPLPGWAEAERWVEALWVKERMDPGESAVVIHPSARWETKRWLPDRYAQAAEQLSSTSGARVIIIGGKDATPQINDVLRHLRCSIINLAGKTTLPQLAALLRRAALMISNDSGPMHLAAALGVSVVALFGPTDPGRFGPYGTGHAVLNGNFDCSGCSRRTCVRDQACMKLITVEAVLDTAASLLRTQRSLEKSSAGSSCSQNQG